MDASASEQLSMQDYFAQPKGRKIAMIVFGVLTALLMAGASFASKKPMTEPVRMAHALDGESTYAYLDIQLLSGWTLRATGDSNYTYYEAMDPDENWFIVALDDTTAEQLQPYTDAYNYFYTDGAPEAPVPEPTRITGMTYSISSDNIDSLASSYSVTSTEYTNFFGTYYLDEGTNPGNIDLALCVIGAAFSLIILLVLLGVSASVRKNFKRSDARLYDLGKADDAEFEFTNLQNLRFERSKFILGEHFAYCGETGVIAALEDVAWLYKRQQRSHGVVVSTQLMAGLKNGRQVTLANRFVTDELIEAVSHATAQQNPDVLLGYSFDYARRYHALAKEYRQNNR